MLDEKLRRLSVALSISSSVHLNNDDYQEPTIYQCLLQFYKNSHVRKLRHLQWYLYRANDSEENKNCRLLKKEFVKYHKEIIS